MPRTRKNVIEYRIYELDTDKPYVCLSGEEWRISDVLSDRLHFHNCLEIGYCFSDSGFLGFENGVTYPFEAGDIFIIPRFMPHTTCSAPGCRSRWNYLYIDPDALPGSIPGSYSRQPSLNSLFGSFLHITLSENPRLHHLCRFLLDEALEHAPEDMQLLGLYALTLSAELRRMLSESPQKSAVNKRAFALKPALEFVNDHYMEPCGVDRLAVLCHLSQTHFRRLFLSIMGTSPLQYVIQIRIRQACILLTTTHEPITAIAQAVGISSISSFNRNFQQTMGISPQQYRRQSKHSAARQRQYILPYKGWLVPENL
ncbi:MAG: helix-turn-helix domain-containing protein [Clostridia bacterium]|nr:helix-turn-helix domain-containing protein [Clostridia bacterium]